VNAGSYSIVPGGLSATNYALNYTAGNLTVNPANLTLSATVSNKVYDGSTSASGSATITSGSLFGSDSLSGGSFNFSDANVGNGKNVTVSGVTITDGNSGNNYSVSYNASSADITPAPLTITATDANTVYDGNAYSGGNGVTYSGFVAGEDAGVLGGSLTYSGSSQGAVDVGTYSIVPGGLTANNYAISFVNGLLNISAAPITAITGILIGTVSKVYDGTTTAVLDPSNFQLSGFAAGEGASVSKTSGTYDSPAAGSGKTVMVNLNNTDYTPSGSTNLANYSLPNTISGAVGEITPAPLSVTANNDSKTYDSQAYSGGNGVTYSGFVNNEDNAVLNGTLSYSGSSQGAVNVGTYPITPGGLSAANYSLSFNDGSLAVNPAPLTISANNASKTYDGQAYSGGNGVTYSGFVAGEDASVLGGSLTYGGSSQGAVNAGTYTITPGGLSADNYGLNFVDGVLEIGRAALQVISASLTGTVTKEYDSTVSAVLNPDNFLLRGFVAGDSATVTATAGTYDNPNAGSGKRVTVSLESSDFSPAAGTDLGNYLLPDSASGNIGTITPAPLDLVVADNSRTYGSAELDTPPSATASGLKGDDTVDDLNLIYSYNKLLDEPATNNGRPTPISARLDNGNYVLRNRQSGDLIINKAPLSGQLGTAEREYRDTLNTAEVAYNSVTWTGLVNGDSPLQITLNFTDDIDRSVGTYPLSAEGSAENYLVTLHDGTLKVQPRALSLRLDGTVTKEYDSTVSATLSRDNFNFTNFPAGESAAVTQTAGTYDTPNAGSGKQVTVNLDASDFTPAAGTDLANYVLPASASNNIGTITPAPLDLVVADNSRTYGSTELDAPPSATVSGLKGSDTVADLNLSYAYNTQRYQAATNNGATTPISASLNNGNYVLRDRQNGALTINKAPLRGQIGTVEREYRDTLSHEDVYNSITWTGLLNDDSPLEITFNFSADIQRSVGTYPLSAQAIAENYLVTLLAGSLNIIPRQLRLQIDDASRLYHAPDPAFTYTLEGLPEGVRLEDIGHLRFHSDAELTSATGNYAVHGEIELANTNYAVNETSPGTLTITPRPVTVALRDMRRKGQESIDVNDFIELNGELFEAYNLSLSPQPNSIAQPGRHQIETDFNLASGERPQTVRLDLNTGTRTQQYTNYTVSVEPAMLYYMPEVRQEITYRHNQEGELVATTTKTTTTYTDGTTTKIVTVKGNSTTTTTIDKDGNKMTNFQVTFNMKPLEIKKEQKDSIVISYPPMPDAGNSNDARTLNSATGKQALQASVASMLAELDKKDQDDPALRAYLHSIRDGKLSLSDVLAQAEAGDKTAQAVVMAVMPTVVTELSKRDPDSLTNDERLLLAKVAERVNAKRQRMVEVAEEKFKQHMEDFKASTKHMGMAKVYADPRFPDVLTETMEQVNAEWAAKAAAVTAIGVGAGAAAGVATAAAVGIIFPHAAAALGVAALSTGFVAAAAAGPALLVAGGTILLAVVIVQQIEDGEREAAYNSFMAQNKKRINNTHELIGDGSDAAKAELMSATLQVFAEIYGEK
jgi:hypothetical protein